MTKLENKKKKKKNTGNTGETWLVTLKKNNDSEKEQRRTCFCFSH